ILTSVPIPPREGGLRIPPTPNEDFPRVLQGLLDPSWKDTVYSTPEILERYTNNLLSCIAGARLPKPTSNSPSFSWWDDECKQAHRRSKNTHSPEDRLHWHKVIRAKKAGYWKKVIDEAGTPKKIFRITRWRKKPSQQASPPLNLDDGTVA